MLYLNDDMEVTRATGHVADWINNQGVTFLGEPLTDIISSDDVDSLKTVYSQVQETQTNQRISCHFEVSNEKIPVELELEPIRLNSEPNTVIGTVRWDSAPSEATEPDQAHTNFQNFIDILQDPAVLYEIVDQEPIVYAVNSQFEKVFGYQAQYIIRESLNDYIVPSEQQSEATKFDKQVADGNVANDIVTRRTASGLREFSYRGIPIKYQDDKLYGLAVYADLTEQQQVKQHLQVLHRVLRHNVRNELTVILGMADKVRTETKKSELEHAASRIISRAKDLNDVSEKAKTAERILGEQPSDTVVEVGQTIERVVSNARTQWPDTTIEMSVESPLPVSAGLEIADALENLIENAIVHSTDSPTVRVTAQKETPIHTSTREGTENIVITIEDDGPGIPKPERDIVFEGADMDKLHHGSGLGLWVVRWIVESANGDLNYTRTDETTTITIRLPMANS
jgi:PAS domain S-box-containing protein